MRVTERVVGHYEAQELEFGRVYRWRPEGVVVECECGERSSFTASVTVCEHCGMDHGASVRKKLVARPFGRKEEGPCWWLLSALDRYHGKEAREVFYSKL